MENENDESVKIKLNLSLDETLIEEVNNRLEKIKSKKTGKKIPLSRFINKILWKGWKTYKQEREIK